MNILQRNRKRDRRLLATRREEKVRGGRGVTGARPGAWEREPRARPKEEDVSPPFQFPGGAVAERENENVAPEQHSGGAGWTAEWSPCRRRTPPPQGPPLPAGVGRPFLRRRHPRSLLVALRNGSSLRFAFSVFVLIFLAVLMLLGWTVQLQLIERKSVRFVCVCVK